MLKKFLWGFLAFLLLLILAVRFGIPYYADIEVKEVFADADSASYSFLDIDVWAGNAEVLDLYLSDSSGALSQQPIHIELSSITIKGLDLYQLLFRKKIEIQSIELGEGTISITKEQPNSNSIKADKPLAYKSVEIGRVSISELTTTIFLSTKNEAERFSGSVNMEGKDLSIPLDTNQPFAYKDLDIALHRIYAQPKESIAFFNLDSMIFRSENQKLTLNGIKMDQRISREKYASHFGYDKDYVKLDIYEIEFFGIPHNLESMSQGLHLPYISVLGAQTYIYKDRRLPHQMHARPFPIEAFNKVKIPVLIDSIAIIDGQLYFDENWRNDYVPGQLYISNMDVKVFNLSNRGPTSLGSWTSIIGDLELYQKLNLGVDWRFDLASKSQAFTLDLKIGSAPLAVLNPFTENTVGMQFKSGFLQGGRLLVEANKTNGAGTLDFNYKKMKIKFLNREDHHQNILEWAEGGLLNLAVRNNNTREHKPHQGVVFAEPKPERAIFGYVIRMFFAGFKDIAIGSKNEKKAKERGLVYLDITWPD